LAEEPAFEEFDEYKLVLPPTLSGPDLKIRIPPELLPDEETILHYFDMYFTNVHPYVPVLNKPLFYHQWHTDRDAISPLILEAIFAIAGRLDDEPAQGHQWLALASSACYDILLLNILLNVYRTCRLFHGCTSSEYAPGEFNHIKSQGVCTKARLLLSLLDDCGCMRSNGERLRSR
jgi:hypothetical protein